MFSRAQYFTMAVVGLLVVAFFISLAPALVNVDLFYPRRIDSLAAPSSALPDPSAVQLEYDSFNVRTDDSLLLKGWYVQATKDYAPTLLIIHDLGEGKVNYLDMLRQMHDRDIHAAVVDLRAHGSSEGREFSPGMVAVRDLQVMLDSLFRKKETHVVCVMGVGVGAFIGTQAAELDDRIAGLLLENAFSSYNGYLNYYAEKKWGRFRYLFMPAFLQKARHQLQMDPSELNLARMLGYVKKPTLFLAGGRDDFAAASESALLKDSSAADQKELFLIPGSFRSQMAETGDDYYNRIAEFVVRTLPPKQKKSRYKRLAVQ